TKLWFVKQGVDHALFPARENRGNAGSSGRRCLAFSSASARSDARLPTYRPDCTVILYDYQVMYSEPLIGMPIATAALPRCSGLPVPTYARLVFFIDPIRNIRFCYLS